MTTRKQFSILRFYNVMLDYDGVLSDNDMKDVADAASREADVGNLDGTLCRVVDEVSGIMWMNIKELYNTDTEHYTEVQFSAEEIDLVVEEK